MKMQNPHYLIENDMNDATRSAYAELKRSVLDGMTFNYLANLYLSILDTIDNSGSMKDGTNTDEMLADILAQIIRSKNAGSMVNSGQLAVAIIGEVNEAWEKILNATRAASNTMQDDLTNFDTIGEYEESLDDELAALKKSALKTYCELHGIEAQPDEEREDVQPDTKRTAHEEAVERITSALESVVDYPAGGATYAMLSNTLSLLEDHADNDGARALFEAVQIILDGDDDGDPADTIREQICSIVGYADDGKTDEMLDDILASIAKVASNRETEALIAAARDILKTYSSQPDEETKRATAKFIDALTFSLDAPSEAGTNILEQYLRMKQDGKNKGEVLGKLASLLKIVNIYAIDDANKEEYGPAAIVLADIDLDKIDYDAAAEKLAENFDIFAEQGHWYPAE